jgi:hypothetical protein
VKYLCFQLIEAHLEFDSGHPRHSDTEKQSSFPFILLLGEASAALTVGDDAFSPTSSSDLGVLDDAGQGTLDLVPCCSNIRTRLNTELLPDILFLLPFKAYYSYENGMYAPIMELKGCFAEMLLCFVVRRDQCRVRLTGLGTCRCNSHIHAEQINIIDNADCEADGSY